MKRRHENEINEKKAELLRVGEEKRLELLEQRADLTHKHKKIVQGLKRENNLKAVAIREVHAPRLAPVRTPRCALYSASHGSILDSLW